MSFTRTGTSPKPSWPGLVLLALSFVLAASACGLSKQLTDEVGPDNAHMGFFWHPYYLAFVFVYSASVLLLLYWWLDLLPLRRSLLYVALLTSLLAFLPEFIYVVMAQFYLDRDIYDFWDALPRVFPLETPGRWLESLLCGSTISRLMHGLVDPPVQWILFHFCVRWAGGALIYSLAVLALATLEARVVAAIRSVHRRIKDNR